MYCSLVREFSEATWDSLPEKPQLLNQDEKNFIKQMINDELDELQVAETIKDQADALIDIIYYTCNLATRKGINLDPLMRIVHSANMRKVGPDGKVKKAPNGKILKPEGWIGPDAELIKELDYQTELGSFNRVAPE